VVVDDTEEWTRKLEHGRTLHPGAGQVPAGSHAEFKFRGPDGVVRHHRNLWRQRPIDEEIRRRE